MVRPLSVLNILDIPDDSGCKTGDKTGVNLTGFELFLPVSKPVSESSLSSGVDFQNGNW